MKDQHRRLASILNLHDFEKAARGHLPRPIFGYISNAAEDGKTLRANRSAFDNYCFLPRALVDVSKGLIANGAFRQAVCRALWYCSHGNQCPFGLSWRQGIG
ncbi:MAG: alpha-hydroxy-acid oxidizing protein [Marinobacter sp.]|nr:alpha-hydroxy-acid oxidizing protein [Marinobacter sp.]